MVGYVDDMPPWSVFEESPGLMMHQYYFAENAHLDPGDSEADEPDVDWFIPLSLQPSGDARPNGLLFRLDQEKLSLVFTQAQQTVLDSWMEIVSQMNKDCVWEALDGVDFTRLDVTWEEWNQRQVAGRSGLP